MANNARNEASIPNSALAPFGVLVGTWATVGTHPLIPSTTVHGPYLFRVDRRGAFLVMPSEIQKPGIPSGVAVFGSDDSVRECYMLYFDERGVSRKYEVTLQRFTGTPRGSTKDIADVYSRSSRILNRHRDNRKIGGSFRKIGRISMTDSISKLLQAYENGKMSRRTLIRGLAMLAAGSTVAEAAGFQGNSVNHISLQVSNLQRSTDFYQRVFDCKVNKREGNNQLVFGKNFLVLREGKPAAKVDHFAIGVDNFNKESVTADLKARKVTPIDQQGGGFGFHVVDPDGFPVQISANM